MTPLPLNHAWNLTFKEAQALQKKLAKEVRHSCPLKKIQLVAGADVSFNRRSPVLYAGIVVLSYPALSPVEEVWAVQEVNFPYVPGYLSFREAPAVIAAYHKLQHHPDVMILDGQGIAHPRGLGLASHVGLLLNLPTIGCAKSRLVGEHAPVPPEKGSVVPLSFQERTVGNVIRTRTGVKPVYVSPGHLMDIKNASRLVLACCTKYRLPEPTRHAHLLVNRIRKEFQHSHAKV